jgi:hypothetical protein
LASEPSRISGRTTAIAAYRGSWERPDNGFADMVLATAAKGDAPYFETPAGTGNDAGEVSSSGHPTSRNTTLATAPSPTPDNDERARQSPLFPVMAKPSDSSPSERPAYHWRRKNDVQTVPLTATEPNVYSAFVPSSVVSNLRRNLK